MQELTDKQKQLLQLYHDGCCAWYKKPQLAWLLKRNETAKQYLDSLDQLAEQLQKGFAESVAEIPEVPGMWDEIERRIEAEERAAFYLGKRTVKPEKTHKVSWYGVLGSLSVAAMATFIIIPPTQQKGAKPLEIIQDTEAPMIQQVNFDSRPRLIEEPAVEMNWLKSAGSVSLIRDSDADGSSVIWVRRNRRPLSHRAKKLVKAVKEKTK